MKHETTDHKIPICCASRSWNSEFSMMMLHTFSEHLKLMIIMIIAMVHELCSQFRGQSGGIVHIVVQTTHLFSGHFTGTSTQGTPPCHLSSIRHHGALLLHLEDAPWFQTVPILHYLETPLFTFSNGCEGFNIRYWNYL